MAVRSSTQKGFVKRATRFEYAQAWNNQRKRMAQAALAENQNLASSMLTVSVNLMQGMADISTRVAVKRITDETKKKFEQIDKLQSSTNSLDVKV